MNTLKRMKKKENPKKLIRKPPKRGMMLLGKL